MFELVYIPLAAAALAAVAVQLVRRHVVQDGHVGLLYRSGRLVATLRPGPHWKLGWRSRVVPIDTRSQAMDLSGQEVLTADSVTVKVTLTAEYRVIDAVRAVQSAALWQQNLYTALQLALRTAIAAREFDKVLTERQAIGAEIRELVAADTAAMGIELQRAAVRDVMLSAELRRAFAEAVRLREEGKAALEKARSETAALRSLANAARMLKDNPDLLSVRVLQSIETVGTTPGNTLVLGMPTGWPGMLGGANAGVPKS